MDSATLDELVALGLYGYVAAGSYADGFNRANSGETTPTQQEGRFDDDFEKLKQRIEPHVFSDKHLENRIMDLGKTREEIMDAGLRIIHEIDQKSPIGDGPLWIKTHINGFEAEIRLFVENGRMISFDMFKGWSGRSPANVLFYK